jgi:hypothetical protein
MKCLNCEIIFSESDIGVMEDWDLQLCEECESEFIRNKAGIPKWAFLKKELIILTKGDNFLTAHSAGEVLKKMKLLERKEQLK